MYIGKAVDIERRWKNKERAYLNCNFIYREMNKHGWDSFDHVILEDNIDDDKLSEREIYWINKLHTCVYDPEYKGGFNLTFGGDGTNGPKPSLQGKLPKNFSSLAQSKRKPVKCLNTGYWNGVYHYSGQIWSSEDECREYFNVLRSTIQHRIHREWSVISGPLLVYCDEEQYYNNEDIETHKQRLKAIHSNNGKRLAENYKSKSKIDYNIYCEETGEIFEKVSDCLKRFNMARSTLNGHLIYPEKHSTAKGFHFKRIPKTNIVS